MCPKETESWCLQPSLPYVYMGQPVIDKVSRVLVRPVLGFDETSYPVVHGASRAYSFVVFQVEVMMGVVFGVDNVFGSQLAWTLAA